VLREERRRDVDGARDVPEAFGVAFLAEELRWRAGVDQLDLG
jgi:hypothetical protein